MTLNTESLPILYSFRRCPYAMRARMGLKISETKVVLREVVLRDKPDTMIAASPKATVPVLVLADGTVIEQSIDIMRWALRGNDPQNWLKHEDQANVLIDQADGPFKTVLDRYKYHTRYEDADPELLQQWDAIIGDKPCFFGAHNGVADFAIFPFVRQFANHDRDWFNAQDIPNIQRWLDAHLTSSLFQSIMYKYPQWHSGDEVTLF
jgi:glutathione S-transferase